MTSIPLLNTINAVILRPNTWKRAMISNHQSRWRYMSSKIAVDHDQAELQTERVTYSQNVQHTEFDEPKYNVFEKLEAYSTDFMQIPTYKWKEGFELDGEHLDPEIHLQIEPPSQIKDLNFKNVEYPFSHDERKVVGRLAYTQPFRVLSDEGVKVARRAVEQNLDRLARQDDRATCYLRGLGMVSSFHQDLAYSPELLSTLSNLSRDEVSPHSTPMNISHTNVGEIGTGRPVDKWHVDSTDYVLVIVLSDQTDMVGGDLRVLQIPDASNADSNLTVFQMLQAQGVPEELVETVKYAKAGYGIFMQGCKILHQVSEVLQAREPRISLVNSYMSGRVFNLPDKTRFNSYVRFDGYDIASVDYARHKAWRVGGQLEYIKKHASYDFETSPCPEELSAILRNASEELKHAADLLDGKSDDSASWVENQENNDDANGKTLQK